jgi:hypothetical protein
MENEYIGKSGAQFQRVPCETDDFSPFFRKTYSSWDFQLIWSVYGKDSPGYGQIDSGLCALMISGWL